MKRTKQTADEFSELFPGRVSYIFLDVTRRASVVKAFQTLKKSNKHVDILVNNAGIGIFTPFDQRTPSEVDRAVDINLKGVLWCSQIAAKVMRQRKTGVIINIGSVYGVVAADPRVYGRSGRNSSEIYAATKAGVIHMTKVSCSPFSLQRNSRETRFPPAEFLIIKKVILCEIIAKRRPLTVWATILISKELWCIWLLMRPPMLRGIIWS